MIACYYSTYYWVNKFTTYYNTLGCYVSRVIAISDNWFSAFSIFKRVSNNSSYYTISRIYISCIKWILYNCSYIYCCNSCYMVSISKYYSWIITIIYFYFFLNIACIYLSSNSTSTTIICTIRFIYSYISTILWVCNTI